MHADEREVGSRDDPRRFGDVVERVARASPRRGGGERADEGGQRRRAETCPAPWIRLDDHPGGSIAA